MLLSHKTIVELTDVYSNIIGHMCYSAYKLWNVCNYERKNYKELNLGTYPDWYYQKKTHKTDLWYKQLPSQTAQQVCKQLDEGWKSFYSLLERHSEDNPRPPRFKHSSMEITYIQNGFMHEHDSTKVRLSLSGELKKYLSANFDIKDKFIYLENKIFKKFDNIKQIKIYPPNKNKCEIIIIYEVPDSEIKPDNSNYLSIDIGTHNLFTCFNGTTGETFIAGRKYLSYNRLYNKEIARVESQWSKCQHNKGIEHPKSSKHINKLYRKKNNVILDYIHKVTKTIISYCTDNNINTLVIGDINGIRENNNHGDVANQNFHSLPYNKIYLMFEYKCARAGIKFVKQEESYTSQCSPLSPKVSSEYGNKKNRIQRGLYKDNNIVWNSDAVGAYNILRKYLYRVNKSMNRIVIKTPYIMKVAV